MIVSQPREVLWAFVNDRLGTPLSEDLRCIGLVADGCIQAVAAYNGWVGRTCWFHGAIDNPARIDRTYIRAIFEYPFVQCKLTHMLALVSEENQKSLSFCFRSGFKEIRRLPSASLSEGRDLLMLELTPNDCKWLRVNQDGKEKRSAAASRLRRSSERPGGGITGSDRPADVGQSPDVVHPVGNAVLERVVCD